MLESSRLCYICQDSEPEDEELWLRPCRCIGSTAWVHRRCLVRWVQDYEVRHPTRTPRCGACLTSYSVVPSKSAVVTTLERLSGKWAENASQLVASMCLSLSGQASAAVFGLLTLSQMYGLDKAKELVLSMEPEVAVVLCQFIPLAVVLVNFIPWENTMLRVLRRASRLPVLHCFLPKGDPNIIIRRRLPSAMDAVVGGLLLPTYSRVVGDLFFRSIPSKVNRILLGGVVFLSIKGVLTMYYKQKIYVRQSMLFVDTYPRSAR